MYANKLNELIQDYPDYEIKIVVLLSDIVDEIGKFARMDIYDVYLNHNQKEIEIYTD